MALGAAAIPAAITGTVAAVAAAAVVTIATLSAGGAASANSCENPDAQNTGTHYISEQPSEAAVADIPDNYMKVYKSAANEYGIDWSILAAIGSIESDHGRASTDCIEGPATAYGTAKGPMQFIDGTWASVGVDGNGDGQTSVCGFEDAIPSAANYLRLSGAPEDYYSAVFAYNNADWYVQDVFAKADEYRAAGGGSENAPSDQAQALVKGIKNPTPLASLAAPSGLTSAASTMVSDAAKAGGVAVKAVGDVGLGMRSANAEANGWDLVDSGQNLQYEDYTVYDTALSTAVGGWDALGSVNVEPSPSSGDTDVYVGDVSSMSAMGYTTTADSSITFNASIMDYATQNAQNAAAAHEFGHALGLAHTTVPSVMNTPIYSDQSNNYETPTEDDQRVYYGIWGGAQPTPVSNETPTDTSTNQTDNGTLNFPVEDPDTSNFTDTWGTDTTGGSNEGTEITTNTQTNIVSMIDGTVEKSAGSGDNDVLIKASTDVGPIKKGDLLYFAGMGGTPNVTPGQTVSAGDILGKVGINDEGEGQLHLGWYDSTGTRAEMPSGAMNPFPMLDLIKQNGGELKGGGMQPSTCLDPSQGNNSPAPGGENAPDPDVQQQATGDAATVMAKAEEYIGTPYATPGYNNFDGIDCSGLTMVAYAAVGIELPHWDDHQYNYGTEVSQSDLQPGDLVFFADPAYPSHGEHGINHVGIYYGGGQVLHASSYFGQTVITDMSYLPGYYGARRLL